MSQSVKKMLAVIDPTTDKQRALERALQLAWHSGAAVHAFLACYSEAETDNGIELRRTEITRQTLWLSHLLERAVTDGVSFTSEVMWSKDWRTAFVPAAVSNHCDLIVKSSYCHSAPRRRLLKTSDWSLLRAASCPVLLVKRDAVDSAPCVLIAINPNVDDKTHRRLNAAIIEIGHTLTDGRKGIELHVVCAYKSPGNVPLTDALAQLANIDVSRVHCVHGEAEEVIVSCAEQLNAELVIVGGVGRSGLKGAIRGNTAERLLDRLDMDVLTVNTGA